MEKSFCHLLLLINHALVAYLNIANMSFNTIRENKILTKISGFTVVSSKRYDKLDATVCMPGCF